MHLVVQAHGFVVGTDVELDLHQPVALQIAPEVVKRATLHVGGQHWARGRTVAGKAAGGHGTTQVSPCAHIGHHVLFYRHYVKALGA